MKPPGARYKKPQTLAAATIIGSEIYFMSSFKGNMPGAIPYLYQPQHASEVSRALLLCATNKGPSTNELAYGSPGKHIYGASCAEPSTFYHYLLRMGLANLAPNLQGARIAVVRMKNSKPEIMIPCTGEGMCVSVQSVCNYRRCFWLCERSRILDEGPATWRDCCIRRSPAIRINVIASIACVGLFHP